MSYTSEQILEAAVKMLNSKGLSAVSIRALAAELGLSPGNVSYYFRRKAELVAALAQRLGDSNSGRFRRPVADVGEFLEVFRETFVVHLHYRGLVLALPDLCETFPEIGRDYRAREKDRRQALFEQLASLRRQEHLSASDEDLRRVVAHLTLIGRFWLAEARLSHRSVAQSRIIDHYLALIADNLLPYAAGDARRTLERYRDRWVDALAPAETAGAN